MTPVSVLDIDLDVFVDPYPEATSLKRRLSSKDHRSWSPREVETYLAKNCNLSLDAPVPGKVVRYHHELFEIWDNLISCGRLQTPFSVTHIDSHADMGMGPTDRSCNDISCVHLHKDLDSRKASIVDSKELAEGNYLVFALACGWLSDVKYVQHPQLRSKCLRLPDIPDVLFKDNDPRGDALQLKRFAPKYRRGFTRLTDLEPDALEDEVPICYYERDDYVSVNKFSFVFFAISPNYTTKTMDRVLPTIAKFIRPL